jgi:serine/threonine protein kinase
MIDFLKVRIFGNKSSSSSQAEGKSPWPLYTKGIGPYVLGQKLGAGSTAEVFEGLDPTNLDRKVAIKVLLGSPDRTRKSAIKEAKIMSCIRHENIACLIGLTQVCTSPLSMHLSLILFPPCDENVIVRAYFVFVFYCRRNAQFGNSHALVMEYAGGGGND